MSATIATGPSQELAYSASGVELDYSKTVSSLGCAVRTQPIRTSVERKRENKLRVVRRLRGLVLDNGGESWTVGFVVNDDLVEYELPADRLRKDGIKMRLQPFEMDEVIIDCDGVEGKGYRFRPLAGPEEAFLEALDLDAERQRLRNIILGQFKKS